MNIVWTTIKKKRLLLLLFTCFILNSAIADEPGQRSCEAPVSPRSVIDCALVNHPAIRRAQLGLEQGNALESQARQFLNPELSSKAVFGKQSEDSIVNAEVSLAQTFELGGKRGARIERALAERDNLSFLVIRTKEEVFLSTLLALYRIRQIQSEVILLEEGLHTFARILKQFKLRSTLGPEQQVSSGIFQLAEADYRLKFASAKADIHSLERKLSVAIGHPFKLAQGLLPEKKHDWPKLEKRAAAERPRNAAALIAESELKIAQSELSLSKSAAWPDIKLGPAFERQTQGASTYNAFGATLTLPLPIFSWNGGGKAVASRGVMRAEENLALTDNEVINEREILVDRYQRVIDALKDSFSVSDVERKHMKIENLFERGLISSSLVIEAHRQILEFTKSQNEQELGALETLWRIYAIDGRMFEERL